MKAILSGFITGVAWSVVCSLAVVPMWVGLTCWLIGTINGVIIGRY